MDSIVSIKTAYGFSLRGFYRLEDLWSQKSILWESFLCIYHEAKFGLLSENNTATCRYLS